MRTMVVFGDSNSYGTPALREPGEWARFGPTERWPGVARQALGDEWTLIEEGLPGRTTVHDDPIEGAYKNGLKFLPVVLESHRPIDLLIISLGTNDLKTRFSVTPTDIANGVGVLIDTVSVSAAGPGSRPPAVLVISPPVIAEAGVLADMFRGGAAKSKMLVGPMADVARGRGAWFIDAATLIASDPLDGIHLDARSHAILGRAVADEVMRMFVKLEGAAT